MRETRDAVVIGAGPAGALAAREIARGGASVLLVDKAAFPRDKVCGCCVNARALAVLARCGLSGIVRGEGLLELRLHSGGRNATIKLPGGVAMSRRALDAALAEAAVTSGAEFLDGALAMVTHVEAGAHRVDVRGRGEIEAKIVIVADGLGGRALEGIDGFDVQTREDGRMGCGCIVPAEAGAPAAGVIEMAVGEGGYVGAVRLEDGSTDVAAALDIERVRAEGGPAGVAMTLARRAGWPWASAMEQVEWRGTPRLTRRRRCVARDGVFVVGDAAGYVEPFTGEGMAWAMAGGDAVAPLALEAVREWRPELALQWTRAHRATVRRRQAACRAAAWMLRRPRITAAAISLLSRRPGLAWPVMQRLAREAVA